MQGERRKKCSFGSEPCKPEPYDLTPTGQRNTPIHELFDVQVSKRREFPSQSGAWCQIPRENFTILKKKKPNIFDWTNLIFAATTKIKWKPLIAASNSASSLISSEQLHLFWLGQLCGKGQDALSSFLLSKSPNKSENAEHIHIQKEFRHPPYF